MRSTVLDSTRPDSNTAPGHVRRTTTPATPGAAEHPEHPEHTSCAACDLGCGDHQARAQPDAPARQTRADDHQLGRRVSLSPWSAWVPDAAPAPAPQTVSRISNWAEMGQIERERTMRILVKRNQCVAPRNSCTSRSSLRRLTDPSCVLLAPVSVLPRSRTKSRPVQKNKSNRRRQNLRNRSMTIIGLVLYRTVPGVLSTFDWTV